MINEKIFNLIETAIKSKAIHFNKNAHGEITAKTRTGSIITTKVDANAIGLYYKSANIYSIIHVFYNSYYVSGVVGPLSIEFGKALLKKDKSGIEVFVVDLDTGEEVILGLPEIIEYLDDLSTRKWPGTNIPVILRTIKTIKTEVKNNMLIAYGENKTDYSTLFVPPAGKIKQLNYYQILFSIASNKLLLKRPFNIQEFGELYSLSKKITENLDVMSEFGDLDVIF